MTKWNSRLRKQRQTAFETDDFPDWVPNQSQGLEIRDEGFLGRIPRGDYRPKGFNSFSTRFMGVSTMSNEEYDTEKGLKEMDRNWRSRGEDIVDYGALDDEDIDDDLESAVDEILEDVDEEDVK